MELILSCHSCKITYTSMCGETFIHRSFLYGTLISTRVQDSFFCKKCSGNLT